MRRSRIDFERLLAELRSDVRDLNLVVAENARAWERIEHGATDRPALLSEETYLLVDELRSVRRPYGLRRRDERDRERPGRRGLSSLFVRASCFPAWGLIWSWRVR
jgi:hypothetical protein